MFTLDASNDRYLHIRAAGRLRASDYDALEPAVEAALKRRGGRAPLLLDLTGWRGWTPGGLVRDLRFDIRHRNSFPRIAVLGDRAWHRWVTIAAKPVFGGEMRFFGTGRDREAAQWVSGN
jgi:hypothetical protein